MTELAFFRSLGHGVHERIGDVSVGWPRVQASCDFFEPIRFEDRIKIRLTIQEIRRRSLRCLYYFFKETDSDDVLIASGRIVTASVRLDRDTGEIVSIEIPPELQEKLKAAQESQHL